MDLEDQELFGDFLEESTDIIEMLYDTLKDYQENESEKEHKINAIFRGVHTVKGSCSMFGMNNLNHVAHQLETYITDLRSFPDKVSDEIINYILSQVDRISHLLRNGDEYLEPALKIDSSAPTLDDIDQDMTIEEAKDIFPHIIERTNFFKDYYDQYEEMILQFVKKRLPQFEIIRNKEFVHTADKLDSLDIDVLTSVDINDETSAFLIYLKEISGEKQQKMMNFFQEQDSFNWIYNVNLELGNNDPVPTSDNSDEFNEILTESTSRDHDSDKNKGSSSLGINLDKDASSKATPKEGNEKNSKVGSSNKSEVIRVPEERINHALDNIWELFLVRNQLSYLMNQNYEWLGKNPTFIRSWELLETTLENNITELEERTMRMRMASLKSIYSRLSQVIRSYSEEAKKQINLVTAGDDTELDKKIIDMLYEPLVHIIRNAMDHGIETVQQRLEKGKNAFGKIFLDSKIIGNEVIVTVSDDGKGMDPQGIINHAKKKNIDVSNIETEKDAINLIFAPGFSTAELVSNISGRGVGMDAVKNSVAEFGGSVDVSTEKDHGSTFTITLPLSMSVTSALVMKINGVKFACTASSITETKLITNQDLIENSNELFFMRDGNYLKCIDLKDYIFKEFKTEDQFIKKTGGAICLIDVKNKSVALRIDSIIDYSNLVIKPAPQAVPSIPFIIGVSILATGEPIFIVSFSKLYEYIENQHAKKEVFNELN